MNVNDYQVEFDKIIARPYYPSSLNNIREIAFSKFLNIGMPTKKWEDWKHTDISIITKGSFRISEKHDAPTKKIDISKYKIKGTHTLVIYNGHYQESSSALPDGIQVLPNIEYLKKNNLKNNDKESSPFDLLNTSLMDSGISIITEPNVNIKKPIHILFICSSNENLMVSPRINIEINKSSSLNLIEHCVGGPNPFLQNTSVFISVKENAFFDHIFIQSSSEKAANINNLYVDIHEHSTYKYFQYVKGAGLSRANIHAYLKGEHSECVLSGLMLLIEKQHCDTHIITDHIAPHCTSTQNFKSVLNGNSSGVFNGRTIVREDSQKTDSKQYNKNLLLSDSSVMNSNPQLEIYADDVKCAHGSTTGALDDEALFYMRSRGIDLATAKSLMIRGFVSDLIGEIGHKEVNKYLLADFDYWLNESNRT